MQILFACYKIRIDALESHAEVEVKEIIALNHGIDPKKLEEKQTILIPAGKLSARDKEILAGKILYPKSTNACAPGHLPSRLV